MDDPQRPKRGPLRRLLGGTLWSAAVTACLAAFVVFALFACKSAGNR